MNVTDEERAKLDAIVRAAGELAACAANVTLGYFLPETLDTAWQRLLALAPQPVKD